MIIEEKGQITVYAGKGALNLFEKKYGKPEIKIEINSNDDEEEVRRKAELSIWKKKFDAHMKGIEIMFKTFWPESYKEKNIVTRDDIMNGHSDDYYRGKK